MTDSVACMNCGTTFTTDAKFCTDCGTPKGAAPQAPPPPPPAAPSNRYHDDFGPRPNASDDFHGTTTVSARGFGSSCTYCNDRVRDPKDPFSAFCRVCRKLDPLGPDYSLPIETFMWSLDAQAMATLRGIGPLMMAARALSEKVGRPWLESTVNGVRLGPDQLPDIFVIAIKAARIVGLPYLPEIYISGEQMWECMTLGSETQAFIVIGSIVSNFKGDDMLYILGREMGHIAAGHALWKTLMQFTSGRQANKTIMGHGIMQFMSPSKIIESAIDAPLMAWARHAEITADRAGALVTGDRLVARRVAIQWTLKSFPLFPRLNLEALEREVAQSDDRQLQVSEWTMTSTPYLARRLRLMNDYYGSETVLGWRKVIEHWLDHEKPPAEPVKPAEPAKPKPVPPSSPEPTIKDGIRLSCLACNEVMRVSRAELEGKESARVQCPNPACGKILEVVPKPPDKAEVKRVVPPSVRLKCVSCSETMQVPVSAILAQEETHVRCPNPDCRKVLTVRRPALPPAKAPEDAPKAASDATQTPIVTPDPTAVTAPVPEKQDQSTLVDEAEAEGED